MNNGIVAKCALLPVGAIATAVGFTTLSNVYAAAAGFHGVRFVTMALVSLVWLAAIIKLTVHHKRVIIIYISFIAVLGTVFLHDVVVYDGFKNNI